MTEPDPRVRIAELRDAPLSVDEALTAVNDPAAGGVALFVGTVRQQDHSKPVELLDYSAHPSAVEVLREVAESMMTDEITAVAAIHRVGRLHVGDIAVVVAVSAPHRGAALTACKDIIDTLKHRVPIWKHQAFRDGSDEWVGL